MSSSTARRKLSAKSLPKSQQLFQHLVEDGLGLICIHDLEGTILYVNPAAAEALEYQPSDGIGRSLCDFLAPSVQPFFGEYLDRMRHNPVDNGILRVVTKSGQERLWAYKNVYYEEDGQPPVVLGHAQDITERIHAEQELRTSEERFRALIERASDMIVVIDAQGTLSYVSPSAARQFGYSLEQPLGMSGLEFVHPDDLPTAVEALTQAVQQPGEIPSMEVRARHAEGSWRVLEVAGMNLLDNPAVGGIVINSHDITERKQAEEGLRHYAERLNALNKIDQAIQAARSPEEVAQVALGYIQQFVPCLRASVVTFDIEANDATILAVLSSGGTQLGGGIHLPIEEFGDVPAMQQGHVHVVEEIAALSRQTSLDQALYAEGVRSYISIPLIFQNELIGSLCVGAETPGAFTPSHVEIVQGIANPVAIAIQQSRLFDQVQRHAEELEQRVIERTRELQEREKLAAAGRMAARIAHEINNPLAGIKSAFRLIKQAVPEQHSSFRFVDSVDKEIDRIGSIVRQMFDLYRPEEEEKYQTFQIEAVVQEVSQLLDKSCQQHDVKIKVEKPQPSLQVTLPEGRVRQILFNLLVNAIEASPTGSDIEVEIQTDDGQVTIAVIDEGRGIPQEMQAKIFEPFFTTKEGRERRGLGLGLSISKNLVEAMGGHLDFRSRENCGMIFQVTLPYQTPPSAAARRQP